MLDSSRGESQTIGLSERTAQTNSELLTRVEIIMKVEEKQSLGLEPWHVDRLLGILMWPYSPWLQTLSPVESELHILIGSKVLRLNYFESFLRANDWPNARVSHMSKTIVLVPGVAMVSLRLLLKKYFFPFRLWLNFGVTMLWSLI